MMRPLTILLILVGIQLQVCMAQQEKIFIIKDTIVSRRQENKDRSHFKTEKKAFYEDSLFVCYRMCKGEFGGIVTFKNKHSGKEKMLKATCPIIVNRIGSTYYVTSSLSHMSGHCEVLQVDTDFTTKKLAESYAIVGLTSFVYKEKLYHIITDHSNSYVTKVENGKFVHVGKMPGITISTYGPEMIYTPDDHLVVFFENTKDKGYVDIYENTILVTRYK